MAGRIVKTRGLRGTLKVLSCLNTENIFDNLDVVDIEKPSGKRQQYKIRKIDFSGRFFFLELDGVTDVDAASSLIGGNVLLPKSLLEALPEGEYYWDDIVGLAVYDEEGGYLGKIESIFPTGSNDVYVCKKEKKEILLPAIADVILKIDINSRSMIVRLLSGLQ